MQSIIIQNDFNRIHQTQGVIMRQYRKQIVWFDFKVKELIFDSSNDSKFYDIWAVIWNDIRFFDRRINFGD